MSCAMHAMAIVLVCFACLGHGRRVQNSRVKLQSIPQSSSWRPQKVVDRVSSPQSLVEVNREQASAKHKFNPFKGLRGGEDSDNRLTQEQIIDKFNRVPVFCLVDVNENLIPIPNEDDGHDFCWFVDAAEAQDLLELTVEANPKAEGIHLAVSPLGAVFELCGGFNGLKGQLSSEASSPYSAGALKLCGPRRMSEATESQLHEQNTQQGIELGKWVLPILCHDDFYSETVMPFFFSDADFKAGWNQTMGEDKEAPQNLAIMDLRLLVNQMLNSDKFDWKICQFVSSTQAIELAGELQAAAKAKAENAGEVEEEEGDANE